MVHRLACMAVLAASCGPELSDAPLGVDTQAVIGAPPDTEHNSVVAVLTIRPSNYGLCTGTVVSPHVVLTAAHCLLNDAPAGTTYWIYDGPVVPQQTGGPPSGAGYYSVSHIAPYPDFDAGVSMMELESGMISKPLFDIAVAVTDEVLPEAPVPLLRQGLDHTSLGAQLHNLGYGRSVANSSASDSTRRHAFSVIDYLAPDIVISDAGVTAICEGDSGGPSLLTQNGTEVVAAIHAGGSCASSNYDTRTDVYVNPFLDPQIEKADPGWLADAGMKPETMGSPDSGCGCQSGGPALAMLGLLALKRQASNVGRKKQSM